jgi:long-chain acyl-CoA synthetase
VVGQSLPQPIALIVLSDIANKADRDEVRAALKDNLKALNPNLKSYERIKKIVVMSEPWTVDNNMLTPTMKIKRNVIEKNFAPNMEKWYDEDDIIIWY